MKVVVIGGTGLTGSKLVDKLRRENHQAVAASRTSGVNTITGDGLAEALGGASAVVDVSNPPLIEDVAALEFFETSTRNLLDAESAAGVGHHVALSIVGIDRLTAGGYFRAKIAQENLIARSSIPHSIVRATQFFEFIATIALAARHDGTVRLPPVLIQPIAVDEVAATVGKVAVSVPVNGIVEVAGPEQFRLDELVRQVLAARSDRLHVVTDRNARYFGAELGDRTLVPDSAAELGTTRLEDWLKQSIATA